MQFACRLPNSRGNDRECYVRQVIGPRSAGSAYAAARHRRVWPVLVVPTTMPLALPRALSRSEGDADDPIRSSDDEQFEVTSSAETVIGRAEFEGTNVRVAALSTASVTTAERAWQALNESGRPTDARGFPVDVLGSPLERESAAALYGVNWKGPSGRHFGRVRDGGTSGIASLTCWTTTTQSASPIPR